MYIDAVPRYSPPYTPPPYTPPPPTPVQKPEPTPSQDGLKGNVENFEQLGTDLSKNWEDFKNKTCQASADSVNQAEYIYDASGKRIMSPANYPKLGGGPSGITSSQSSGGLSIFTVVGLFGEFLWNDISTIGVKAGGGIENIAKEAGKKIEEAYNETTKAVTVVANTIGSAINTVGNALTSAWNIFASWF